MESEKPAAKKIEIPPLTRGAWRLADLPRGDGPVVMSTFACGGGSSMGYRLAGCRVASAVEVDGRMAALYRANLGAGRVFVGPIQEFNRGEAASATGQVDILDGSPPCSVFSMAGSREKKWGIDTKTAGGKHTQKIDDLFFHFIETVGIVAPKVAVAENVEGLIKGNAKGYVREIFREFQRRLYDVQIFLFNASRMGVPQRRRRVFFIARRIGLGLPPLEPSFDEPVIAIGEAVRDLGPQTGKPASARLLDYWRRCVPGRKFCTVHPNKNTLFSYFRASKDAPLYTLTSTSCANGQGMHWSEPRGLSTMEMVRGQTFPDDYDFGGEKPGYVIGMSVPPLMMQRVALTIRRQWLG